MVNLYQQKLCQKNLQFFEILFLYNGVTFYAQNNLRSLDDSLSFFWWNVNFFCFLYFFLFFWFKSWSNFISYFISNQISCLEAVFAASFTVFVAVSINFSTIFITEFSCKWQKAISFNAYSKSWFYWVSHFYDVWPIISIKLTLSSISSALLVRSVNQTSTEENSVLTVFIIVKECGEIFINCPNCLFGTKVNKTFDVCW